MKNQQQLKGLLGLHSSLRMLFPNKPTFRLESLESLNVELILASSMIIWNKLKSIQPINKTTL